MYAKKTYSLEVYFFVLTNILWRWLLLRARPN